MAEKQHHLDYKCEDCGKEMFNAKSLSSHKWLAHHKRSGRLFQIEDKNRYLTEVNTYIIASLKKAKAIADGDDLGALYRFVKGVKTEF